MLHMGIKPEKWRIRKKRQGESVFPETDPISLFFRFAYIPFVMHRDKWKFQSHVGVSSPDLYQNQVLHINVYKKVLGVLHHLMARGLLTFYDPFFLITASQPKNLFSRGDFS